MNAHEMLSEDGHAVLALCSGLGLKEDGALDSLSPLKLSEWNDVANQLSAAGITPAALPGKSPDDLMELLRIDRGQAEQMVALLDRGGRLALELERLFSAGMWAVTRVDTAYPARMLKTLKHQAPSVLFGAGDAQLLDKPAIAIVGSRNIDETAAEFAKDVGRKAAQSGLAVVSGGAKGTDRIGMQAALEADGFSFGAMADSLERTIRQSDVGAFIRNGRLVLLTPYVPSAGFSVGAAMGRNKLIYGLADYAVVVSSDFQTGGTWAGAVEALKGKWCPIFVRTSESVPKGNSELLRLGAVPMPADELGAVADLNEWLQTRTPREPRQADLFS
jgi:predicted Rossmann fold nucleotide-binding protein DprA/Smf involved in DNA uptake